MPNPSSYLEASLARWADRRTLARRDVEIMMDGLEVKGHFLEGLRLKILQHRKDDFAQLREARRESWAQWDERLKRLEAWMGTGTDLAKSSSRLVAWHSSFAWFDRAQALLGRYCARLSRKAAALENQLAPLSQGTRDWSDRLILKESEISKLTEPIIPSTKKSQWMDFVYAAREKEGELSRHFKTIRAAVSVILERLGKTKDHISARADANPAAFEIRKNQALETWTPIQKHFAQLRETVLSEALLFEEGRTRLRSIYDALQKIRVIQEDPPRRRPLLERLFNSRED